MRQVLGRLARVGLLSLVALVLAGCAATGPRFSEVQESFPAIKPGHGRLMVYRSGGLGPAIQPDVRLNGDVVGKMQPEGFFFVDRPTGRYTVSARTEIESSVDVVRLVGVVAAGALATGVLYIAALLAAGQGPLDDPFTALVRFWIGDTIGILVTLPLVLMLNE